MSKKTSKNQTNKILDIPILFNYHEIEEQSLNKNRKIKKFKNLSLLRAIGFRNKIKY